MSNVFNKAPWNAVICMSSDDNKFYLRLPNCPDFPKGKSFLLPASPEGFEKAYNLLKEYTTHPDSPEAKARLRKKIVAQINSGVIGLHRKQAYPNPIAAKQAQCASYDESMVRHAWHEPHLEEIEYSPYLRMLYQKEFPPRRAASGRFF